MFGDVAEEVIGQPITILIPPDRLDEEREILSPLKRGERVDHFETIRKRKDGSPIDISLTISPVRDESGKIIGASKVARDITQSKKMTIVSCGGLTPSSSNSRIPPATTCRSRCAP